MLVDRNTYNYKTNELNQKKLESELYRLIMYL